MLGLGLKQRADMCENPIAKRLLELMEEKQTNLALSADVTSKKKLLEIADQIGPEICIFKTHIDIIDDFDQDLITQLKVLALKHDFLIFEDRKFADIGNTVRLQYEGGIYHIVDWADIINAHSLPGPGIIEGLKAAANGHDSGLLLLGEMSGANNLFSPDYINETVTLAEQYHDYVIGFIAQRRLSEDPRFIHMTPGVKLEPGQDAFGQTYLTPETAITENLCDIIIVGRGIIADPNPLAKAKEYRHRAWQALFR